MWQNEAHFANFVCVSCVCVCVCVLFLRIAAEPSRPGSSQEEKTLGSLVIVIFAVYCLVVGTSEFETQLIQHS